MNKMLLDRFEVQTTLGEGSVGRVIKARDTKRGIDVALKIMYNVSPLALQLLKREFRNTSNLSHPNLVNLFELFSQEDQCFISMDYIDGVDLYDFLDHGIAIQPNQEINSTNDFLYGDSAGHRGKLLKRINHILPQLAEATQFLHDQNIIHLDIKPANIMIDNSGKVFLLDFGLTHKEGVLTKVSSSKKKKGLSGTIGYIAPEVFAERDPSFASDWFAIGVIIYEGLSFKFPFEGLQETAIIETNYSPTELIELIKDVPKDLSDLTQRLLQVDPEKRSGYSDIQKYCTRDQQYSRTSSSGLLRKENIFVGRESEISTLESSWDKLSDKSQNIFIYGSSGVGKSALVEKFLVEKIKENNIALLKGKCYEYEYVPFKALDCLIDSIIDELSHFESLPVLEEEDIISLLNVFPTFACIDNFKLNATHSEQIVDKADIKQRAIKALQQIIDFIASQKQIIIYVDDLQWADLQSANALFDILKSSQDKSPILFIGASRSENLNNNVFHNQYKLLQQQSDLVIEGKEIHLKPLNLENSLTLVKSYLENTSINPEQFSLLIAKESLGSPFFAEEIVNYINDRNNKNLKVKLENITLDEIISSRIEELSLPEKKLLELISIAEHPVSENDLLKLNLISRIDPALIKKLQNKRLIRVVGNRNLLETYHDKVREIVKNYIEYNQSVNIHKNFARIYQAQIGIDNLNCQEYVSRLLSYTQANQNLEVDLSNVQNFYQIAFHFYFSNQKKEALNWSITAADYAMQIDSFDVAKKLLKIAKDSRDNSREIIFHIELQFAKIATHEHQLEQAKKILDRTAEFAQNDLDLAIINFWYGEIRFRAGEVIKSIKYYEDSLQLLESGLPKDKKSFYCSYLWTVCKHALVQIFRRKLPTPNKLPDFKQSLIISLHRKLTFNYYSENTSRHVFHLLKAVSMVEKYIHFDYSATYASYGLALHMIKLKGLGEKVFKFALDLQGRLPSSRNQAHLEMYCATKSFINSRYEEAIEFGKKSIKLVEKAGNIYDKHFSLYLMAASALKLGKIELARKYATDMWQSLLLNNDRIVLALGLQILSNVNQGKLSSNQQVYLENFNHDGFISLCSIQMKCEYLKAAGVNKLYAGDLQTAEKYFNLGIRAAKLPYFINPYTLENVAWLLTTLRINISKTNDITEIQKLNEQVKILVDKSFLLRIIFKSELTHIYRELGLIELALKNYKKSEEYLAKSYKLAMKQSAKYEAHITRQIIKGTSELSIDVSSLNDLPDDDQLFEAVKDYLKLVQY